jgi:hypothetical protein
VRKVFAIPEAVAHQVKVMLQSARDSMNHMTNDWIIGDNAGFHKP